MGDLKAYKRGPSSVQSSPLKHVGLSPYTLTCHRNSFLKHRTRCTVLPNFWRNYCYSDVKQSGIESNNYQIVIVTVQYALIVIVTVQYAVIYSYLILSSYKLQFSIFVLKYLIIYNFQLIRYANFSFLLVPRYVLYYSKLYLYLFHCHHLEDIVKMYEWHNCGIYNLPIHGLGTGSAKTPVSVPQCLCIARISVIIRPSTGLHSNKKTRKKS